MICYLDSCRDKTLKLCTPEKFRELTESQRTSMLIEAFRSGENPQAKSQLPAFVFMGYDPKMLEPKNDRNTEIQKTGSRKKSDLVPTGLVMFDFDHISKAEVKSEGVKSEKSGLTPYDVYDRFLKMMPKMGLTLEHDLALAHVTPSGDGLRTVIRVRKNKSVAEIQEQVGKLLGIECDKAVKDISRLSFCPKSEDILFMNQFLLFATPDDLKREALIDKTIAQTNDLINKIKQSQTTSNNINNEERNDTNGTDKQSADKTEQLAASAQGNAEGNEEIEATNQTSEGQGSVSEHGTCGAGHSDLRTGTETSGLRTESAEAGHVDETSEGLNEGTGHRDVEEEKFTEIRDKIHGNYLPSDVTSGSRFPEEYHGVSYKAIVEKWIELRGGTPEPGDRHATLVELAMDLRKICDNDKDWIASLMPDFDKGEEEKLDCIEWAVGRQHSKVSGTLLDALTALGVPTVNSEKRKVNNGQENSSLLTIHSSLSEQSEALPPAMPEKLPTLVELLTSKVLPHQKPALSAMIFPALAVHVNNCLFKLRDNTDVELSLMCCLLAQQSVGKGCVKAPLRLIMKDIKAQDKINRQRERQWQEDQKNKKANEKGKSRPDDIVIRILSSDTTPAAFLGRLLAAENGDGENPNLCTYSQVDEIEDLYRFCASGGRNMVQQMIKRTWDRDDIGAERWSANSANISTVLRWNWAASSTIEGGKKFFKNCLTDGTTSRVDFCTIIPPAGVIDFCYGDYDDEFEEALQPYIDNLRKFSCAKTDTGKVIPCTFPEIRLLEERMNHYINEVSSTMPDNTWENYAWRAKVMAIKKLIVLYIANGCQWEDTFEPFVWWSFNYGMWCKMNLFYDAAAEQFRDEQLQGNRGNKSPLKEMHRTFTLAEFTVKCQEMKCKCAPNVIIRKYKQRGVIAENGNSYIISPEFCKKWYISD